MSNRTRPDYLLLIRGQVPYNGMWQGVLAQKHTEMKSHSSHAYIHGANRKPGDAPLAAPPLANVNERFALWFYKGTTAAPHSVSSFVYWHDVHVKRKEQELHGPFAEKTINVASLPVYIYFPNEYDWYVQSDSSLAILEHAEDPCSVPASPRASSNTIVRKNYHDPPGRNALVMAAVRSVQNALTYSLTLNLAEYEICRGPRRNMRAREYFADGKNGQRVACLKRIKTTDPAHLARLHIEANLTYPFALRAKRK